MKSRPNIAAINTHVGTEKTKNKSAPEPQTPSLPGEKTLGRCLLPAGLPVGTQLPHTDSSWLRGQTPPDAKGTGEASARAVGALGSGGVGWGGRMAGAGGDSGCRKHIPRPPLPRIVVAKLVAPRGQEFLVGCSSPGRWDHRGGWGSLPGHHGEGCISPSGNPDPGASYPSIQDLAIPEAKVRSLQSPST